MMHFCRKSCPKIRQTLRVWPEWMQDSVTLQWLGYLHRSWRAETTGIDVSQRAESIGEGIRPRGHRHMAQPETTPCHAPVTALPRSCRAPVTPLSRSCHAPVTLTGGGRVSVGLCPSTLILPTCGCTSPLRRLTCLI